MLKIPKEVRDKVRALYESGDYISPEAGKQILKDECEDPDAAELLESYYTRANNKIAAGGRKDGARIVYYLHREGGGLMVNTDNVKTYADIREIDVKLERQKSGIIASQKRIRERMRVLEGQVSFFD